MRFSLFYLLISQKSVYLQCVFHSIRFKVNKKDWLSGIDSLFLCSFFKEIIKFSFPLFSIIKSSKTIKKKSFV